MTRPIVEIEHYFNKEKIMDQNLQEQILYILRNVTSIPFTLNTRFHDVPLDSMDFAELASIFEAKYDIKPTILQWDAFWKADHTVADLARFISTYQHL